MAQATAVSFRPGPLCGRQRVSVAGATCETVSAAAPRLAELGIRIGHVAAAAEPLPPQTKQTKRKVKRKEAAAVVYEGGASVSEGRRKKGKKMNSE